LILIEIANKII